MSNLEAVCFDMDGVIIDTEPLYSKAQIQLFREYGVEIPEEDWVLFKGCNEHTFYDLSMNRYNITENREKFMNKGRRYVKAEFDKNLKIMTGFKEFHNSLKENGIKTALVTASPKEMFLYVDKKLKFSNIFEEIVIGDMVAKNKPHPDPYLLAFDKLSVLPQNSVVIEDSVHGINSGLSAGAFVVGIRGSVPEDELQIAHHIISSHLELSINLLKTKLKNSNLN